MDILNVAIGGIVLVCCLLPFVLTDRKRNANKRKMIQALNHLALQNNAIITQSDYAGKFVIGLDEHTNNVFFLKVNPNGNVVQSVDLADVKTCRVNTISRTVKENKSTQRITEKLELVFIPIQPDGKTCQMEIYNEEESLQLTGELQLVEKWAKLVNDKLKTGIKVK
jgi:hypothetical protein